MRAASGFWTTGCVRSVEGGVFRALELNPSFVFRRGGQDRVTCVPGVTCVPLWDRVTCALLGRLPAKAEKKVGGWNGASSSSL